MVVYAHDLVKGIIAHYGDLLYHYEEGLTIRGRLDSLAALLWSAFQNDDPVVLNEINNYNPKYISKSWAEIRKIGFTEADAYMTIAHQYGYLSWDEVPDDEIDIPFEMAVDYLLAGDQYHLNELLLLDPTIVMRRSQYRHGATLLHYVGSNGVELYRQVVPNNLPTLLEYLVQAGADPKTTMYVYGGDHLMIDLLNTSAHPRGAGLVDQLNDAYVRLIGEPQG